MRLRSTLFLGLIAVALGAYLYFVEFERAAQEAKKRVLLEFDQESGVALTLTYPDREIELQKRDDGWWLVKPIDTRADETTVKNLLRAVAECEVKKNLEDVPSDLAPFGLDKPAVVIHLRLKDRDLPLIRVGKQTPVGYSAYVQRADEPKIYLTNAAFRAGLEKQPDDLRDKQILTFRDEDLTHLALRGPDRTVQLGKIDGQWRFDPPFAYAVDETAVRSFVSALRNMRANGFPAEAPADLTPFGLAEPRLVVALGVGKDQELQLLVGGENDKKEPYVKTGSAPTVYTVGEWIFGDLNKTVNDFRDKTVMPFERRDVARIDVRRSDGGTFALVRGDDKVWTLADSDTKPSESQIDQYVTDLKELKGYDIGAEGAFNPADFGLDAARLVITLTGEEGRPLGTVRVGTSAKEPSKTQYAANREGDPVVYLVRDYVATRLDKQAGDFLPRPTPTPGGAPVAPPGFGAEDDDGGFGGGFEEETGEGE